MDRQITSWINWSNWHLFSLAKSKDSPAHGQCIWMDVRLPPINFLRWGLQSFRIDAFWGSYLFWSYWRRRMRINSPLLFPRQCWPLSSVQGYVYLNAIFWQPHPIYPSPVPFGSRSAVSSHQLGKWAFIIAW